MTRRTGNDPPTAVTALLSDMAEGRLLGASRQVLHIADLFCKLAREQDAAPLTTMVTRLQDAGERIRAARGHEAPAVADAVRDLLTGIASTGDRAELASMLEARTAALHARIQKSQEDLGACGAAVLADGGGPVVVYDYSSSVVSVLASYARAGHTLRVIVPESRMLNGGLPIVSIAVEQGHEVAFVPDSAIGTFLPGARAVLTGAEALLADGSCINTVGCMAVAILAQYFRVPFYVVSDLSKLYAPSYQGYAWPLRTRTVESLVALLPPDVAAHSAVTVTSPEVERIPGVVITAYITDRGLLPPAAVHVIGRMGL